MIDDDAGARRGVRARTRTAGAIGGWRGLMPGAVPVTAVLGLAGAPPPLAIDAYRVPEGLRAYPVAPGSDALHQPATTAMSRDAETFGVGGSRHGAS